MQAGAISWILHALWGFFIETANTETEHCTDVAHLKTFHWLCFVFSCESRSPFHCNVQDLPPCELPLLLFKKGSLIHFFPSSCHVLMFTVRGIVTLSCFNCQLNRVCESASAMCRNSKQKDWEVYHFYQEQPIKCLQVAFCLFCDCGSPFSQQSASLSFASLLPK